MSTDADRAHGCFGRSVVKFASHQVRCRPRFAILSRGDRVAAAADVDDACLPFAAVEQFASTGLFDLRHASLSGTRGAPYVAQPESPSRAGRPRRNHCEGKPEFSRSRPMSGRIGGRSNGLYRLYNFSHRRRDQHLHTGPVRADCCEHRAYGSTRSGSSGSPSNLTSNRTFSIASAIAHYCFIAG
jgi:hypothetical protein